MRDCPMRNRLLDAACTLAPGLPSQSALAQRCPVQRGHNVDVGIADDLWLPFVNYGRTYREVAARISAHLPAGYHCIRPVRLGDAQLASFAYFGRMRFSFDNPACDTALRQSARN